MIILDTNVVSEVMRAVPSPNVLDWLANRPAFDFAVTTITVAEIRFGLARLPLGRRRHERERLFDNFCARSFTGRILSFDELAADAFGELIAARERSGRPLLGFDSLIAAIAVSRGLGLATRNIRDFEACGIAVVDPWKPGAV